MEYQNWPKCRNIPLQGQIGTALTTMVVIIGIPKACKSSNWLRQGNPLSPILLHYFVIVVEAISCMLLKAKCGTHIDCFSVEVPHLQFAADAIIQ